MILGCLAGGGLLVGAMLGLAATAIALGWIARDGSGRLDLGPWLNLQVAGGAIVSVLAGGVSRAMGRGGGGPLILAGAVLGLGFLEAAEILRQVATGAVTAPVPLVLLAPVVSAAGVLLGGWRPGTRPRDLGIRGHAARWPDVLRYALPLVVLVACAALARLVVPRIPRVSEASAFSNALALDFTVTVPGLVYLLLVRTRRAPWIVLVPAFLVGYALAVATIPGRHQGLLDMIRYLVIPAELAVVACLAILARRAFFLDYDLSDGSAGFAPPAPFTLGELDPTGPLPERVFSKAELIAYLQHGRRKLRATIESLGDEQAARRLSFGSMEGLMSEWLLYNMRHVQHHAAQLNLISRQTIDEAPRWVARSPDPASTAGAGEGRRP